MYQRQQNTHYPKKGLFYEKKNSWSFWFVHEIVTNNIATNLSVEE